MHSPNYILLSELSYKIIEGNALYLKHDLLTAFYKSEDETQKTLMFKRWSNKNA